MIRVTEAQAELLRLGLFESVAPRKATRGPRKDKTALPENQVEAQILGFLRARGWLCERQQAGVVVGIGPLLAALNRGQVITRELLYRSMIRLGEKGRADWVAVRVCAACDLHKWHVERLEIEVKSPGKKPSAEQAKYLRDRAACGFLCGWWDSVESFQVWYDARFL